MPLAVSGITKASLCVMRGKMFRPRTAPAGVVDATRRRRPGEFRKEVEQFADGPVSHLAPG
jgi:hypothetical protein